MSGRLTTHGLDTYHGVGAAGLVGSLRRLSPDPAGLGSFSLDAGGRAIVAEDLIAGVYELVFEAGAYHRARAIEVSDPAFLDQIVIRFGIAAPDQHYHVPLVFTPYSYSTYRGG